MTSKWIDRTLISSPYCIGLCISEKDFLDELERLNVPENDRPYFVQSNKDAAVHFFKQTDTRNLCALVCIKPRNNKIDPNALIGLLIHEADHIWRAICDELGETFPSKEFEAYSLQAISQRLIEKYKVLHDATKIKQKVKRSSNK